MKRKLGIIILAVLLCAVLIFTMVACKKNGGDETPSDPGSATLEGVDNTQIAKVEADLQAYLNTWVETHATETAEDQKNLLRTELNAAKNSYKLKGTDKSSYSPTFNVSFADGKYTVKVSWGEGKLSKTLTVNAKTVTYTNWAGRSSKTSDYEYLEGNNAVSETIDTIVVGLVNSVNKVTANSVTGKFGMDGKLGFDAFGKNYALRVKGNVDTSSKPDNEVGLVIENAAGKEIAGLYYKGADNAKDSRLYIQYLVTENGSETVAYKYIEYADILGFLSGLLTDKEGKSIVKTEAGDGVFASDIDGLTALLTSLDVPQAVRGMIPGIVKLVAKAYQDGDRYLIDINLADVMNKVSDIMSIIGNGEETKLEFLDAIGLDPMNMSGLFGHISISAKVTEVTEGGKKVPYLSDFEFALNIPEDCTFYFSADEDAVKFDLPSIGFAIYLEDFSFVTSDETPIANVIPQEAIRNAAAGKGYFSPTNVDLSGDVYINHKEGEEKASIDSTFHFELVTDINPLEIVENGFDSNARAALVIRQHSGKVTYDAAKKAEWSNFLSLSYEQKTHLLCMSGTAFGLEDGGNTVYKYDIYTTETDESGKVIDVVNIKAIKRWLGLWDEEGNYHGLKWNGALYNVEIANADKAFESAKAIYGNNLVKELVAYFIEKKLGEDEEPQTPPAGGVMEDIGDYVDGVKAIYESLIDKGVIKFTADPFSLSINVTDKTIEDVVDALNTTFELDLDASDIEDLKVVKVEANSEGFTDKVYIKVVYGGNTYELLFDGSSEESKFLITFTMTLESNTYTIVFDATSGDSTWTASVTVDIEDSEDANKKNHTEVTVSNFHGEWGNDNVEEVEALLREIKGAQKQGEIFPEDGTGPATAFVKGLFDKLTSEKTYSTVKSIGRFIIRQIAA